MAEGGIEEKRDFVSLNKFCFNYIKIPNSLHEFALSFIAHFPNFSPSIPILNPNLVLLQICLGVSICIGVLIMGLFKRLAGLLGFARDEDQQHRDDDTAFPPPSVPPGAAAAATASAHHLPRRGFAVPVQVPVDRAPPPPLLVFCPAGDGGLQGLRWYARRLRIDEDGDVADEFLDEVSPDTSMSMEDQNRQVPKFEVKYSTKPAKVRNLALLPNGKIQHLVEYQGRLEWL